MDVTKGMERYLRHHRAAGSSPKTLKWHETSLTQFVAFLSEQTDLEGLCADDLRRWIDELQGRGLAQASVATKVRSVKAFGAWLLDEEYTPRNPFAKVKQPKVDDTPKPTFTPEEVDKLLAACRRKSRTGLRDFAAMLLMFSTGLRAGEVVSLRVEDIDYDKSVITVRRGKGGKLRVVPLGRRVERALNRYLDDPRRKPAPGVAHVFLSYVGTPLGYDGLYQAMKARGETADVEVNPHKFRHSAAIQYLRNGGRVEVLRTMLGHTSLRMTLHYARIAGVDLTTAHETCDPTRSLKVRV